ncbi:MAG: hypothetical protein RLZZ59_171 [Pseudomonadota bacterium]|jgi:hypothetical protein
MSQDNLTRPNTPEPEQQNALAHQPERRNAEPNLLEFFFGNDMDHFRLFNIVDNPGAAAARGALLWDDEDGNALVGEEGRDELMNNMAEDLLENLIEDALEQGNNNDPNQDADPFMGNNPEPAQE